MSEVWRIERPAEKSDAIRHKESISDSASNMVTFCDKPRDKGYRRSGMIWTISRGVEKRSIIGVFILIGLAFGWAVNQFTHKSS